MAAPEDERVKYPLDEMARLAQSFLPIKKWGFKEVYRSNKDERLIYNSTWCRVKFIWSGWEMYAGNTMSIYYGRLHAPDDRQTMIWNSEKSYCWHGLTGNSLLDYLDGLTPQDALDQKGFPRIIEQFRQSEIWQELAGNRREPELTVRMNAVIWEHYGLRLFEMFDLRRPDLWEDYTNFLTEYYKNWEPIPGDNSPLPYKRC